MPRIIKAILIGFFITLIGGVAFFTEESFFPFTTIQTAQGIDYLLIIIFGIVFSPIDYFIPSNLTGGLIDTLCILVTLVFWASVAFILLSAAQFIKRKWRMVGR